MVAFETCRTKCFKSTLDNNILPVYSVDDFQATEPGVRVGVEVVYDPMGVLFNREGYVVVVPIAQIMLY